MHKSLLLLGLSGCGPKLGPPHVDYADPAPIQLVHTDNDPRRWFVPVSSALIGDRLFFLDTGYTYTTCDDTFIDDLGLVTAGRVKVRGELGTLKATKALLPAMTIGGHQLDGLACVVRDLHTTSSISDPREVPVAGVLGIDVLRRFTVEIDPAAGTMLLVPPRQRRLRRHDPGVVRLKREYRVGARMLVPVQLGDLTLWPIVDTGASGSHFDGARLGLTPSEPPREVMMRGSGAKGYAVKELDTYQVGLSVAGLGLGPVSFSDRKRGPFAPGLLGLDVLSGLHQTYDFRRRRAAYLPSTGSALPSWTEWKQAGGIAGLRLLEDEATAR